VHSVLQFVLVMGSLESAAMIPAVGYAGKKSGIAEDLVTDGQQGRADCS